MGIRKSVSVGLVWAVVLGVKGASLAGELPVYDYPPRPEARALMPAEIDAERVRHRTVERRFGDKRAPLQRVEEAYLPLAPGDGPLVLPMHALKTGLYSIYLYGTVAANGREKLDVVWKPCPMQFELRDATGAIRVQGRRLLKQGFEPRRMQGFHFHIEQPGDYQVVLTLPATAMETAEFTSFHVEDQLTGLPDEAVKRSQNLASGPTNQLAELTEARRRRDDAIWASLPPLNVHLQVHKPNPNQANRPYGEPPPGREPSPWTLRSHLDPNTKNFALLYYTYLPEHAAAPLDMVNRKTGSVFPHEQVVAGVPWPGDYPDDGTGLFYAKQDFPALARDTYYAPRADLLGERVRHVLGLLGTWDHKSVSLPAKYFANGDPEVGHDAAILLARMAYDWPAVEMNLHEIRLCTHAPDYEYNVDWSGVSRNGKYHYHGWSGTDAIQFMIAYDHLFPFIQGNQVLADALHRFIPWVKTPQDAIRLFDRWLVFASVRDVQRDWVGAAPVESMAGQVLGPHRLTEPFFDLTRQQIEIYPCHGTYQELYATGLSRSGTYYGGSFFYQFGEAANTVDKAHMLLQARRAGVSPPLALYDVRQFPKVRAAASFLIDMWPAGGFPFMYGDASGGPHTGRIVDNYLERHRDSLQHAFELTQNPVLARVLVHRLGNTDTAVVARAAGGLDPILHAPSRVIPDQGAIVELGVEQIEPTRKTAATLRLGIGQGHAHADYLDLNLFAMGLPIAVDLACRAEGGHWSYPKASSAGLHNHAIAHDDLNFHQAGGQRGEPWLRAFMPPLLRASYVNDRGDVRLDRELLMMEIGNTGDFYAFDVQRLRGGKFHTWSFHGCESEELTLNTPMQAGTTDWLGRMLAGTHKVGTAGDTLQATWTMTREGREHPHTFMNGGVVKTVGCEPTVLGAAYRPELPPVRVRATLLGRSGDRILQGNPYSEPYAYCFPFLWAQSDAVGESVYPAIYEWYRGETPVVAKAELLGGQPLVVRLTTTSGQIDTFEQEGETFRAVSRDAKGIRWAQLSGGGIEVPDLKVTVERVMHRAVITDIDYRRRRLTTDTPLPPNPVACVGNDGRRSVLALRGRGTTFAYDDDLLIHEGQVTDVQIKGPDQADIKSNQKLLFAGQGNRKAEGFTVSNESGTWNFRGGKVIRRPEGAALTPDVFTDASGDGRVHAKTYELGIGDTVELPANVIVRRLKNGSYEVRSNVPAVAEVSGARIQALPEDSPTAR